MPDARSVTAAYEHWLGEQIPLDAADLRRKHHEISQDEYRFLRGTYYLWLLRAAAEIPEVFGRAPVPLVGDLHVENYGTWSDREGVRRWGVNDLDELARGPWLLDLVRLATSAILAPHVVLDDDAVCDTVLGGWYDARPGPAVELRSAPHLAALVPEAPDDDEYYRGLDGLPRADDVPRSVADAARATAPPHWRPTWHVREAGTGSLGHRRRAGLGRISDLGWVAREAKQLGPPTCVWFAQQGTGVTGPQPDPSLYAVVLAAVGGPGAATRTADWQVRELAPDCLRISPEHRHGHEARRLLIAMAGAVAGIHAAEPGGLEAARRETVAESELRAAVAAMTRAVRADFRAGR